MKKLVLTALALLTVVSLSLATPKLSRHKNGKAKAYAVNSVNTLALLNKNAKPREKIEWLKRYDGYLTEEVLPFIRNDCGGDDVKPFVMGISLGAYLAANVFLRKMHVPPAQG